ncbi:MAG: single-stranded-DNA-specific exonuclease RecJ [Clostridia bacterium]|nr:single-stranded-DNA-specific exonuclease RecJ [Clostridia bacterium]
MTLQKNWTSPPRNPDAEAQLIQQLKIKPLLARTLVSRGFSDPENAAAFLQEQAAPFYDPFLFKDMDIAVRRIKAAIHKKEHITVYGDYDADGVCATSLLLSYLQSVGAVADYYIPSRLTEGYGMNESALSLIAERGTTLIITVDTGIAALSEVLFAKELGMDVIVTDHHNFTGDMPEALAVIRAQRPGDSYPFGELCGAGVAFKLVCALSDDTPEVLFEQYGEQVAIATIADLMPLMDENRAIVRRAIRKMQHTPSVAVAALLTAAGFTDFPSLSSTDIAYYVSPMINAAGRIASADAAFSLFMAKTPAEAEQAAEHLVALNARRRAIEAEVSQEALSLVEASRMNDADMILVVAHEGWHCGVVGIAAARLVDTYQKPVIVLSSEDGVSTGSGRSVDGFDLYEALTACSDMLMHAGGHSQAVGLTIAADRVSEFRDRINAFAKAHYPSGIPPVTLCADGTASLAELTVDAIAELNRLAPFGAENPPPMFIFSDTTVKNAYTLKEGKHLKMNIEADGMVLDCIGFSLGNLCHGLSAGTPVRVAARPDINCFRGKTTPQLKLVDVKPSSGKEALPALDPEIRAAFRKRVGICYSYLMKLPHPFCGSFADLAQAISTPDISFSEALTTGVVAVLCELSLVQTIIKSGQTELSPIPSDKKLILEESPSFLKLVKYADHYLNESRNALWAERR